MAVSQSKRSVRPVQPKRRVFTTKHFKEFTFKDRRGHGRRLIEFPLFKGKTVEKLELYTAAECHCIAIDFQDQTTLTLQMEPGFFFKPKLLRRRKKAGAQVLKIWPPIQAEMR